jgi:hypothetical protein
MFPTIATQERNIKENASEQNVPRDTFVTYKNDKSYPWNSVLFEKPAVAQSLTKLWNFMEPKIHHRVNKIPPLILITSQITKFLSIAFDLFKIYYHTVTCRSDL